ncbi:hypothetical protein WJX72_005649 [[Myrmecia] bisecta]|uniref:Uncharacterized protein n=1 Tax=[Myrmecia] bisecta TaxID=41462 RepID=A0AAW1R788_9CHLO
MVPPAAASKCTPVQGKENDAAAAICSIEPHIFRMACGNAKMQQGVLCTNFEVRNLIRRQHPDQRVQAEDILNFSAALRALPTSHLLSKLRVRISKADMEYETYLAFKAQPLFSETPAAACERLMRDVQQVLRQQYNLHQDTGALNRQDVLQPPIPQLEAAAEEGGTLAVPEDVQPVVADDDTAIEEAGVPEADQASGAGAGSEAPAAMQVGATERSARPRVDRKFTIDGQSANALHNWAGFGTGHRCGP